MRKLRNFVVWTLIAVAVEMSVFCYANANYFKPIGNYKEKKIEIAQTSKKFNVSIPQEATYVKVSYDGSYVSYYVGDNLKVEDTAKGKAIDVQPAENAAISLTQWVPGSEMLTIVEKSTDSRQRTYMKLYSYNADKNEKVERIANDTKKVGSFMVSSKNDKIEDACNSTQSGSFYLKITDANLKSHVSQICRVNVMNEPETVQGTQGKSNIGKINQIWLNEKEGDQLIYEDTNNNKVKVLGGNYINLPNVQKQCLLNVDSDNNIYIGEKINDKVTKISYGTYQTPASNWQSIKFDNPIDEKDIYINESGKIYTIDNLKGTVTEVQTKKVYKFSGTFVQIYEGGIATLDNGKLVNTVIKTS